MLLRNYMAWASGMAQLVKALATKPNKLEMISWDSHGKRRKPTSANCLLVCLPPALLSITQLIIRMAEEEKNCVAVIK